MVTKPSTTAGTDLRAKTVKKSETTNEQLVEHEQGNTTSVTGVKSEQERMVKPTPASKITSRAATAPKKEAVPDRPSSAAIKTRRRPRKLNKDRAEGWRPGPAESTTEAYMDPEAMSELEALKSRVRGLEAKVEQLYRSGNSNIRSRSPRRRGKNRKTSSSSTSVQTPKTLHKSAGVEKDASSVENEAEKQVVDVEGELERARLALNSYRPRTERNLSHESEDDVEEIPRHTPSNASAKNMGNKQITLSGSYRIPIPASVSVDDVNSIKSGVSAAQNVARTFMEQRRAAAALRAESISAGPQQSTSIFDQPTDRSTSIAMDAESTSGKQSWGDWVGGYSLAITRAVKSIEHEAAMEMQGGSERVTSSASSIQHIMTSSASTMKKGSGKRPAVKTKLSSEQVRSLMH